MHVLLSIGLHVRVWCGIVLCGVAYNIHASYCVVFHRIWWHCVVVWLSVVIDVVLYVSV